MAGRGWKFQGLLRKPVTGEGAKENCKGPCKKGNFKDIKAKHDNQATIRSARPEIKLTRGSGRRLIVFDEPVVVAAIGIANDVIEDDELLELQLKILGRIFGKILGIEAAQPIVSVFITGNERLKRANLNREKNAEIKLSLHFCSACDEMKPNAQNKYKGHSGYMQ